MDGGAGQPAPVRHGTALHRPLDPAAPQAGHSAHRASAFRPRRGTHRALAAGTGARLGFRASALLLPAARVPHQPTTGSSSGPAKTWSAADDHRRTAAHGSAGWDQRRRGTRLQPGGGGEERGPRPARQFAGGPRPLRDDALGCAPHGRWIPTTAAATRLRWTAVSAAGHAAAGSAAGPSGQRGRQPTRRRSAAAATARTTTAAAAVSIAAVRVIAHPALAAVDAQYGTYGRLRPTADAARATRWWRAAGLRRPGTFGVGHAINVAHHHGHHHLVAAVVAQVVVGPGGGPGRGLLLRLVDLSAARARQRRGPGQAHAGTLSEATRRPQPTPVRLSSAHSPPPPRSRVSCCVCRVCQMWILFLFVRTRTGGGR